jgi:hypothetical protein
MCINENWSFQAFYDYPLVVGDRLKSIENQSTVPEIHTPCLVFSVNA